MNGGFSLQLYEKYHSSRAVNTVFKLCKWYQIAQSVKKKKKKKELQNGSYLHLYLMY